MFLDPPRVNEVGKGHECMTVSVLGARRAGRVSTPINNVLVEMERIRSSRTDVIAMGRGDPDLPTPRHIVEAAKRAIDAGATHYTPPAGDLRLRHAIARSIEAHTGVSYDPACEILVTVGAQEAMFLAIATLVEPGDEVLLPEHRFTAYDTDIELHGGRVVTYPNVVEGRFQLDVSAARSAMSDRTKLLVIVSPDNPTGGVAGADDIAAFAELARERDLLVISDEIYDRLLYDDCKHHSIIGLPGMRDRSVLINSLSKTYAMTGWRVGYLAGPADFVAAATELKHTFTICTPALCQQAALAALEGPQECVANMLAIYDQRRQVIMAALSDMGLPFVQPAGAFYVYTDVRPTGMTAEQFCPRLLEDTGVSVLPGTMFGGDPDCNAYIRMSVLTPPPKLGEALERMESAVRRYRAG